MPLVPAHVDLNNDEMILIEAARDFARTELLPLDRAWDRGESSVFDIVPKLGEMGFLNLLIPAEYDGLGCSFHVYASILHEIAYASPSASVTLGVHNMIGSILCKRTTDLQRQLWLPGWSDPGNFAAFAVSEAGAGSDSSSAKTTADVVDAGFCVNGEKMWVTNGMNAHWIFTLVRLRDQGKDAGFCVLLIDSHEKGIERSDIKGKMGIRGSETAVIHFDQVFVPQENLIGKVGDGLAICLSCLNSGRLGIAAQATGIAEACLDESIRYARTREQFNRPIGKFQAVANMISDSAVELEAAKALLWRAVCALDADVGTRGMFSMAKLYASECANRIAYRAVQIHGGTGYVNESRVEQLYRDARITTIYEGTSEIQRIVIARELAGK